jgi:hypothetical protein
MAHSEPAVFHRDVGGHVVVAFDEAEERLYRQVLEQVLGLLETSDEGAEADPLAASLGIGTSTTEPEDPALARLFPTAYKDDPEAAADFRRYTEPGLRNGKAANMRTALDSLRPGHVELTDEQAQAWLSALNDCRLVLGERLSITEDWDERLAELADQLADDDPVLLVYFIYSHLSYLQESLVEALAEGL